MHYRYHVHMAQLVTRIDDDIVHSLDDLVDRNVFASRSDAVRIAVHNLVEEHRRREIGQTIANAYVRTPQTAAAVGWGDAATRKMIEAEPW